jgi:hypothetical protein
LTVEIFGEANAKIMTDLFEVGRTYVFYFGGRREDNPFSAQVVSYEHPLVKVETKGLIRIINCASDQFLEAISRLEGEEPEDVALEE